MLATLTLLALTLTSLAEARNKYNLDAASWIAISLACAIVAVAVLAAWLGSERPKRKNIGWIVATSLLCLAGAVVIAGIVFSIVQPSIFWHSIVFQDLSGVGTLVAAGAAWLSALASRRSTRGQITDRYTKAIEQLGSEKLDVRLGGLYALERIAHDSRRDRPTIVEVLRTFVQEHSRPRQGDRRQTASRPYPDVNTRVAADVQAGINVLIRLPGKPGLRMARLDGADLCYSEFARADLRGATFAGANLVLARLTHAFLDGADLTSADLGNADLAGANLVNATLTGADLAGANLVNATLTGADLTDALWAEHDLAPKGWKRTDLGCLAQAGTDPGTATG